MRGRAGAPLLRPHALQHRHKSIARRRHGGVGAGGLEEPGTARAFHHRSEKPRVGLRRRRSHTHRARLQRSVDVNPSYFVAIGFEGLGLGLFLGFHLSDPALDVGVRRAASTGSEIEDREFSRSSRSWNHRLRQAHVRRRRLGLPGRWEVEVDGASALPRRRSGPFRDDLAMGGDRTDGCRVSGLTSGRRAGFRRGSRFGSRRRSALLAMAGTEAQREERNGKGGTVHRVLRRLGGAGAAPPRRYHRRRTRRMG